MKKNNVFYFKDKNGNLIVDIRSIQDWIGFEKIAEFVISHYSAKVIDKQD